MRYPLADPALGRRVEGAWGWAGAESARALRRVRPDSGAVVEAVGGGSAAYFGPGSPLSQAQGVGHDGPVDDDEIDRLDAFYASRATATSVVVGSLADPSLLPALSRRGFVIAEQEHVLVRPVDLDPADASALPGDDADPGLTVAAVRDGGSEPERLVLTATVLGGFFEGPDEPPAHIGEVMEAMTAAPSATGWLARLDAEAAGGAVLLVHGGAALFAGDATLPAFRRRGVQAALIRARLAEAARLGCDLAAVCTQPGSGSQRNYERLGFRVAYARTLMVREPAPDPALGAGA